MISKLHYITQSIDGKSHLDMLEKACQSGVDWVQLRIKNITFENYLEIAKIAKEICDKYKVHLIINDQVEIAKIIDADGVHLGKDDMHPSEARKILGKNKIIGGTANTFEAISTKYNLLDYIGLGPFRFTSTKEKLSPVLGLKGYQEIMQNLKKKKIEIPIIAIGGIQIEDIEELMKTEIHGIAVASLINNSDDKTKQIQNIKSLVYA